MSPLFALYAWQKQQKPREIQHMIDFKICVSFAEICVGFAEIG